MSNVKTDKKKVIILVVSYLLALVFILLAVLPMIKDANEKVYYGTGTHKFDLTKEYQEFEFKFDKSGNYTFKSSGKADTEAKLTLGGKTLRNDDNSGDGDNFSFQYYCKKGEVYRLYVRNNKGSIDDYKIIVSAVKSSSKK